MPRAETGDSFAGRYADLVGASLQPPQGIVNMQAGPVSVLPGLRHHQQATGGEEVALDPKPLLTNAAGITRP